MENIPIQRNKWKFYNENYDGWVRNQLEHLTPEQKARLPIELVYQLDRGIDTAMWTLSDDQIKYILSIACGKISIVIFEDEEAGMGVEEWNQMYRTYRGKGKVGDMVDTCRRHGAFFLGNHDMMKYLTYINFVHSTNLYKLASDFQNIPIGRTKLGGKVKKVEDNLTVIWKQLLHAEGNRKRMKIDYDVEQPEWYALVFFSYFSEATSTKFFEHFKYALSSSRINLKKALTSLRRKGLIDHRGPSKRYTYYHLTAQGKEVANKILARIYLNF